jgi:hypothetical protein
MTIFNSNICTLFLSTTIYTPVVLMGLTIAYKKMAKRLVPVQCKKN